MAEIFLLAIYFSLQKPDPSSVDCGFAPSVFCSELLSAWLFSLIFDSHGFYSQKSGLPFLVGCP